MDFNFADRMDVLGGGKTLGLIARARHLDAQGRTIVHFDVGEPDFETPAHIIDAAFQAMRDGYTHYAPVAGLMEARQAIADYAARTRGIKVSADQVMIGAGSKNILFLAFLALVNPGDEVVFPDPGYPIYPSIGRLVGARLRPIRLREDNGFRLDLDELRSVVNARTRLVILNSPHNPCGSVMDRSDVESIAEVLSGTNAYVLSDEIYGRMLYEGEPSSIAAVPGMQERTIILDGVSKTYAMTGWRIGFGVMHPGVVEKMAQLMNQSNTCAAAFSQIAAIAALSGPQASVDKMLAEMRIRRQIIVDELNKIEGVQCRTPKGAFYAFPNVSAIATDVDRLSAFLLDEGGIACLPGTAFGEGGRGYLRFSYATSQETIREGMKLLSESLKRWRDSKPG